MKQALYEILSNKPEAPGVYRMVLSGDTYPIRAPGQFADIRLDGFYLRRPISLFDWDMKTLTVIYRVVGQGTEAMSRMQPGQMLDLLLGLGNGFDTAPSGKKPLLIGGGVGAPPLFGLCKKLLREGKKPQVILGAGTREALICGEDFRALGVPVIFATADGSCGIHGLVTDAMKQTDYSYFYTCGPMPMFRAIHAIATTDGQFSFEERMGCGFGACMGCTCHTKSGAKRICKDGPVLFREDIEWETQA